MNLRHMRILSAAAAFSLVLGCAAARRGLVSENIMRLKIVPHPDIRFEDLDAFQEGPVLSVAGSVRRRDGLSRASGGHVDIAILDAGGSSLAAASSETDPVYTSRHRISRFKAGFQIQPPAGGTVAAAFHVSARKTWKGPSDCGENRALASPP